MNEIAMGKISIFAVTEVGRTPLTLPLRLSTLAQVVSNASPSHDKIEPSYIEVPVGFDDPEKQESHRSDGGESRANRETNGGDNATESSRKFFSIAELALRWRCSRGTVYNRLRSRGTKVLDFAPLGKKGKKVVHANVVLQIEAKQTKRLC
jgi:hypothetical protein